MDWEEEMELNWGPTIAHESGHALMALLQGIPCHGIYFERGEDGGRFCALFANPSDKRSKKDYLVSAAGVAAALLRQQRIDVIVERFLRLHRRIKRRRRRARTTYDE